MPTTKISRKPQTAPARRRRPLWVVACILCLALTAGCARKPVQRPKPPKPWFHARAVCVFPLDKNRRPETPRMLAASMAEGWRGRMRVPAGATVVRVEGERYPALESMCIDLSNAEIEPGNKSPKLRPKGKAERSVKIESFQFVGQPLKCRDAKINVGMTASAARLDVGRDKKGRPLVTLMDAKDGRLQLEVSKKDVDSLLLAGAKEAGRKYGVIVDHTKLKLKIVDDRSVRADLKINTRIGFLPAGLRFKAKVDIDDRLYGRITNVACEGDQLLGPLISGLIQPALKKYEGKTRPLVAFPGPDMRLRDFHIEVDEMVRLDATFGS